MEFERVRVVSKKINLVVFKIWEEDKKIMFNAIGLLADDYTGECEEVMRTKPEELDATTKYQAKSKIKDYLESINELFGIRLTEKDL